jgi:nucleoside-diphosphate-sugar epimerase
MRALVTGASGFIGGVLCERLLADGHEVHALVRRPGSEPAGTNALQGDLGDSAGLTELVAVARPDCVFHLAAEIASQKDEARLMEVNVGGTERLISACLVAAGGDPASGPQVVFASTVVTGDAHGRLLTEDEPLPVETAYGRSKQDGERKLLASGLPVSIVRPSHVYGPGGWYAQEMLPRLRQPGRFAVIGSGRNMWDVVHVDDVVQALVLAAQDPRSGEIYHVADDEPITFYDFMALSASELGVGPPRRIPAALARLVAGGPAVQALVRSARSSNAKVRRDLGWDPRFPTAREGVPAAVAHLA